MSTQPIRVSVDELRPAPPKKVRVSFEELDRENQPETAAALPSHVPGKVAVTQPSLYEQLKSAPREFYRATVEPLEKLVPESWEAGKEPRRSFPMELGTRSLEGLLQMTSEGMERGAEKIRAAGKQRNPLRALVETASGIVPFVPGVGPLAQAGGERMAQLIAEENYPGALAAGAGTVVSAVAPERLAALKRRVLYGREGAPTGATEPVYAGETMADRIGRPMADETIREAPQKRGFEEPGRVISLKDLLEQERPPREPLRVPVEELELPKAAPAVLRTSNAINAEITQLQAQLKRTRSPERRAAIEGRIAADQAERSQRAPGRLAELLKREAGEKAAFEERFARERAEREAAKAAEPTLGERLAAGEKAVPAIEPEARTRALEELGRIQEAQRAAREVPLTAADIEAARGLIAETADFLKSQERPGRYFAEAGEGEQLLAGRKGGEGQRRGGTWYGITSQRKHYPWLKEIRESPKQMEEALARGKGPVYERLIEAAGKWVRQEHEGVPVLGANPFLNPQAWRAAFKETPQMDVAPARLKQVEQARQAVRGAGFLDKLSNFPGNMARKYYDQFRDLRGAVKSAEKRGLRVRAEEDPGQVADIVYGGTGGRIEAAALDYGDVIRDAKQVGLADALRNVVELRGYDRAIRIIEVKEATARTLSDMAAANEYARKLQQSKVVPAGYNRAQIAQDLAEIEQKLGPKKAATVNQLADRFFDLNRQAWDAAHDAGIISDAVYQQGLARGKDYIPLERIFDVAEETSRVRRGGLSLKQQQVLKRLEGSERVNRDPFEASLDRHAEVLREAGRNRAAKTLVEFAARDPQGLGQVVVKVPEGARVPKDVGTIAFYENGVRQTYALPKELADAMNLAQTTDAQLVSGTLLRFSARVFRAGATTANLSFSIPNVLRDVQDLAVLSKAAPKNPLGLPGLAKDWARSLIEVAQKSPGYREFLRSGAAFSTLQKSIDPGQFLKLPGRKRTLGELLNVPGRMIDTVEKLNNALEEATKLTAYKRLRKQGMTEAEAAIETRRYGGSPDFARRGTAGSMVNLLFMFSNAQLQGIGRTFARLATDPKRLGVAMGTFTMMALALDEYNRQYSDEEGQMEMRHVPRTDRQRYWVILRPETYTADNGAIRHRYWKIPKGHVGQLLFNPIETALQYIRGEETDLGQAALDVVSTASPGSLQLQKGEIPASVGRGILATLNPAIRVPVEELGNLEAYGGRRIVPRGLEDVAPRFQRRAGTSPTAVRLGQLLDQSPLRIEHIIRGTTAGVGEQVLSLSDWLLAGEGAKREKGIRGVPVVGPLARRFVGGGADQVERDLEEKFYKRYQQAEEASRTFALLRRDQPEEAEGFVTANAPVLQTAGVMRKAAAALSALRRQQLKLLLDSSMDSEERERALHRIHRDRMEILRAFAQPEEEKRENRLSSLMNR